MIGNEWHYCPLDLHNHSLAIGEAVNEDISSGCHVSLEQSFFSHPNLNSTHSSQTKRKRELRLPDLMVCYETSTSRDLADALAQHAKLA